MTDITAEELKLKMDNKENFTLIDVREDFERDEFNIGGLFAPLRSVFPFKIPEWSESLKKDSEIIVYCRSGARSGQAKLMLEQAGFSNVRNLIGGMIQWRSLYS